MADGNQYVLLEDGPEPVGGNRRHVNREPLERMVIRAEGTTDDHVWENTHRPHTLDGIDYVIFEYKGPAGTHSYPS